MQKGIQCYEYLLFAVYNLNILSLNLLLHMKAIVKRTKVSSYSQLNAMQTQM